MDAAGFKRLSLYAAPELDELLRKARQPSEPRALTDPMAWLEYGNTGHVTQVRDSGNGRRFHNGWAYL